MTVNHQKTTQKNKSKPLHSGHRKRLRERFLVNNGKDFTDHELLELLLFYLIPRANTNELAHKLINEFGSLQGVFDTDPAILERVDGAGKATSLYFKLHDTIMKRIGMEKNKEKRYYADALSKVGEYLLDYYRGCKSEEFCVMLLDNSLGLIEFEQMSTGSINSANVDVRKIAKYALLKDASHVILSHNHPSGTLHQSSDDRVVTLQVQSALNALGISLMEHIIVNDTDYATTMHMRPMSSTPLRDANVYREFYKR